MPDTKQDDAVGGAIELLDMMERFRGLRAATDELLQRYTSGGWNATWGAMATAAQETDGSIGAADVTPNAANPITVGSLNRSKNALVSGIVLLQQFENLLGNAAVTQGDYNATIDALVS